MSLTLYMGWLGGLAHRIPFLGSYFKTLRNLRICGHTTALGKVIAMVWMLDLPEIKVAREHAFFADME